MDKLYLLQQDTYKIMEDFRLQMEKNWTVLHGHLDVLSIQVKDELKKQQSGSSGKRNPDEKTADLVAEPSPKEFPLVEKDVRELSKLGKTAYDSVVHLKMEDGAKKVSCSCPVSVSLLEIDVGAEESHETVMASDFRPLIMPPTKLARIETLEVLNKLRKIVEAFDGIQITRGGHGLKIPMELISTVEYSTPTKTKVADVSKVLSQYVKALMLVGDATLFSEKKVEMLVDVPRVVFDPGGDETDP